MTIFRLEYKFDVGNNVNDASDALQFYVKFVGVYLETLQRGYG